LADPWRDLGVRLASGLVLLPLGIAAIWFGGPVWTACLSVIVAGLIIEWVMLWRARLPPRPDAVVLILGLAYIALAWPSLFLLRAGPAGLANVLFVMVVVWAGDIGAYIAGRAIGGPRLAPSISPGKTWSGAAGGTFCAVLAGLAVARMHLPVAGVLALGLSVVAQLGDLLESALKRRFGAKDSGRIIPGHGGLLDRLDGVLAAAPAGLAVSLMVGPGPLWG
jgi:phosphatidate cytidylyltransferase